MRNRLSPMFAACALGGTAALILAGSAAAAFPGANGKIAFAHQPGAAYEFDIFTMDPNGQNPTPLTSGPDVDLDPYYSGNGEKIAFSRWGSSSQQIWIMNHDGTEQTQLTDPSDATDVHPAFSPDGKRIAFERYDTSGGSQIWIMNADGSGQMQLTFPGPTFEKTEAGSPSFSPHGQTIVFDRYFGPTGQDIWVMNVDGSGQTRLTTGSDRSLNSHPDFSPNGQRIVFAREAGSSTGIWVMNSDGSGQSQVTDGVDGDPVFSPDGMWVAFGRAKSSSRDIFLADPNGLNQNVMPLTNNSEPVGDLRPSWQPLNPPSCYVNLTKAGQSYKQVSVTLSCDENATAVLEGSGKAPKVPKGAVASKAKKFTIPPVTVQVPEETATEVTLRMPKKGRKALKKAAKAGRRGKATITATLTDDLGQSSTERFKVKFKAKKK
jgi:Tol biopolymer transport system component